MNLIITLIACLTVSALFRFIARKLSLSVVVGSILSGILLGSPIIKPHLLEPNTGVLLKLGDWGFIILMFLAGLEISWCLLYEERKESMAVAFFAATIPLILGTTIFLALGFSLFTSLAVGISMAITAEATKARVLLELNKLNTRIGALMMGAGILDDILGLTLFGIVSYLFTRNIVTKEFFHTMGALLAFFLGILIHRHIGRSENFIHYFEKISLLILVPFFFISMGIHFSFQSITIEPWLLLIIIIAALAGKILGSMIAKPFTKLNSRQLILVGWGMNSRGAIELAIAYLALQSGLISLNIYSSLIIMALSSTIIFPFIIKKMIKKHPQIMGETVSCKLRSLRS